jgi:hypothetical protein
MPYIKTKNGITFFKPETEREYIEFYKAAQPPTKSGFVVGRPSAKSQELKKQQ